MYHQSDHLLLGMDLEESKDLGKAHLYRHPLHATWIAYQKKRDVGYGMQIGDYIGRIYYH